MKAILCAGIRGEFRWIVGSNRRNQGSKSLTTRPMKNKARLARLSFGGSVLLPVLMALSIGGSTTTAADQPAAAADQPAAAPAPVPAPPPPKPKWETTAAAGLTLTRGNSDTLLATLSLDTKGKWEKSEVALGISAGYGENNSVRNTEFVLGYGDYHHLITDRFYAGIHVDGNYDGIAALDYRVDIAPLAGYYLIKTTNTSLSIEGGPALVLERYSHQPAEGYWGVFLGERFEQKLSSSTKLWESANYVARVDRWSDKYVITAEVGIDTAITKKWSLRTVFQDIYDSLPARNHKHNDMRLIAGTAYKF